MNNGLQLTISSLEWFGEAIFQNGGDLLTAVPTIGALSLALGLVLALFQRDRRLLFFLLPIAGSLVFVFVAGILDRSVAAGTSGFVVAVFVIAQLLASAYFVVRLAGSRLAATAIATFSICYALHSAFIAGMSFTGDWI